MMSVVPTEKPTTRRFAESRAGNLARMAARNLRALQAERRSRCWGRPGCQGEPAGLWLHAGETMPFAACERCGLGLAALKSFRPFDGLGGEAA